MVFSGEFSFQIPRRIWLCPTDLYNKSTGKSAQPKKLRILTFYLMDLVGDFSPEGSLSGSSEGVLPRLKGTARMCRILQQKPGGQEYQKITVN